MSLLDKINERRTGHNKSTKDKIMEYKSEIIEVLESDEEISIYSIAKTLKEEYKIDASINYISKLITAIKKDYFDL